MQGTFVAGNFNIHLTGSAEDFADLGIALDCRHGRGKEEEAEVPPARGRLEVLALPNRRTAVRQERGMQEVRRSEGCSAGALHILRRFGIDWGGRVHLGQPRRVTRTTSAEPLGAAAHVHGEGSRPLARALAVGSAPSRRAAGQPDQPMGGYPAGPAQPIACKAQVSAWGQTGESSIAQSLATDGALTSAGGESSGSLRTTTGGGSADSVNDRRSSGVAGTQGRVRADDTRAVTRDEDTNAEGLGVEGSADGSDGATLGEGRGGHEVAPEPIEEQVPIEERTVIIGGQQALGIGEQQEAENCQPKEAAGARQRCEGRGSGDIAGGTELKEGEVGSWCGGAGAGVGELPAGLGVGLRGPRHLPGRPHLAGQLAPCHWGKDALASQGQGTVTQAVHGREGNGSWGQEQVGDGPGVALPGGFGTFSRCDGADGETGKRVQWCDIAAGDLPRPPEKLPGKWADEALSDIEVIHSDASDGGTEAARKRAHGRPPDDDLCDTTTGSGESDKADKDSVIDRCDCGVTGKLCECESDEGSVCVGGGGAPGGFGAPGEPQQQRSKARRKQRQKRSYLAAAQAGDRVQCEARAGQGGAGALHRPPETFGVLPAADRLQVTACSIQAHLDLCDKYWRIHREYVSHYVGRHGKLLPKVDKFYKAVVELSKDGAWCDRCDELRLMKLNMIAEYTNVGGVLVAEEIVQVAVINAQVHALAELSDGAYVEGMAKISNWPRGQSG
jgi:hypothetical protein